LDGTIGKSQLSAILREIESHLLPSVVEGGLRSLAIYGLGGVGKTQIALAYAHEKLSELEAVFWIPAETELALQQAFSEIAVQSLKLPNAHPQAHHENTVLVKSWLQMTSKYFSPPSCQVVMSISCEMAFNTRQC